MNKFGSVKCCCGKGAMIICIYDESQTIYNPSGNAKYDADVSAWSNFIEDHPELEIRLGILVPNTDDSLVIPTGAAWPHDSDREEITHFATGHITTPRLTTQEIVDFYELVRTTPDDFNPEKLLFALDNSGSITVSMYSAELAAAKAELEETYDLTIAADLNTAQEEWVFDALLRAASLL